MARWGVPHRLRRQEPVDEDVLATVLARMIVNPYMR